MAKAKQLSVGDTVWLPWRVAEIWPDDRVTLDINLYAIPITLRRDSIEDDWIETKPVKLRDRPD